MKTRFVAIFTLLLSAGAALAADAGGENVGCNLATGENAGRARPAAYSARGYELLTTKPFLPPDFDQETFDILWQSWEEPLRSEAAEATVEKRRAMAFSRYGLTTAPGDPAGKPQQYIVDAAGNWTITCLACHQGKVAGMVVPGLPNSLLALQTLTDEVRATKFRTGKKLTRMDLGSTVVPLGTSNGTTNAVIFGVALMANRDPQLNVVPGLPEKLVHHDHDAPAWWNFKKKQRLYSDGFALKDHRPLMQFMLIPENGPEKFREWEDDFRAVYDWLESLEAPKYPFEIDATLARQGEAVFSAHCAECHGTYGPDGKYPNKIVSIEEVGTDPVRLGALSPEHRNGYKASWFSYYGEHDVVADPGGYVAPPLDGIWASAPYFHNGSVPTLWHVLHSSERPAVWSRSENGYDREKVGLEATAFDRVPKTAKTGRDRRHYFNTAANGKSAAGHAFPDELSETEKREVLEYLKTL